MSKQSQQPPLVERLLGAVGLTRRTTAAAVAHEAYAQGAADFNDDPADATLGIQAGAFGYTKTGGRGGREPEISFEQNLQTAWQLYQSNALISRGSDIERDYTAGMGVTIGSDDDELAAILKSFSRRVRFASLAAEIARQLNLFGAQCITAGVRESDGRVSLGYIDPGDIERVIADPDNPRELYAVVVREFGQSDPWATAHGKRVYRIIREDDRAVFSIAGALHGAIRHDAIECGYCHGLSGRQAAECAHCHAPLYERVAEAVHNANYEGRLVTHSQARLQQWEPLMLAAYGLTAYSGDCFLINANAVSNQTLGRSKFIPVSDNCDQYDDVLFALGEREQMAGYFSFHVQMAGADEPTVAERASKLAHNPPQRGSALVTNDKETWNMLNPDLNQAGSIETVQELRRQVWGGLGYPEAWFGTAAGTHLATTQSQNDPTWRSLEFYQATIRDFLTRIGEFVRDQAIISGNPDIDPEAEVSVTMPEMTTKDLTTITAALSGLVMALAQAVDYGWIDNAEAAQGFAKIYSELGVTVDLSEVMERIGAATGANLTNPQAWESVHAPLTED